MSKSVLIALSREEFDLVHLFRQLPEEQRLMLLEEAESMVASRDRMRILAGRGSAGEGLFSDSLTN